MGRAKYISHLDVTRCMQRAVKRAGLPVWYTEGFNPHIYLTFALPLSLGYESESETMDFRLTTDEQGEALETLLAEVRDRMNDALPPDIRVVRVDLQKQKPDTIVSAVYEMTLTVPSRDGSSLRERFELFYASDKIEVEKRSKRGVKLVDLKPDCQVLRIDTLPNGIGLTLKTAAGTSYNVNPTLLTDAFFRREGITNPNTQVLRKSVNVADGTEFV